MIVIVIGAAAVVAEESQSEIWVAVLVKFHDLKHVISAVQLGVYINHHTNDENKDCDNDNANINNNDTS